MELLQPTPNLTSVAGLDRYFDSVATAPERVLLLDFDGTLSPFTQKRDQAIPYPGVVDLLNAMPVGVQCRMALITGRSVESLRALLSLERTPEIWGAHGWERLRQGEAATEIQRIDPTASDALRRAKAWAEREGLIDRCELKTGSLALHWRGLEREEIETLQAKARAGWSNFSGDTGLELRDFDGGIELRVSGHDKGTVVETILSECRAGATVAYLGDDLTDEDAFAALAGKGLSVLVRPELRPTAAQLWLRPPDELLLFLEKWRESCSRGAG